MKKEVIEIEVKWNGKDEVKTNLKDIGSVIQEQKDITIEFEKELRRLEEQLSKTSKGNLATQKSIKGQIDNVKDALKDQRIALKDLGNQQSKAVVSNDLTAKSVARNYGAIQLLDQVTGGMATQFRSAYDASKLFNLSLKGMKSALIATGIGALVVALGAIVAYWDDIVAFIDNANGKLQKQIELQKSVKSQLEGQLSIIKEREVLLELQGKSTTKNREEQKEILKTLLIQNDAVIEKLKLQLEVNKQKGKELSTSQKILGFITGQRFGITKLTEEEKKAIKDTSDALNEATIKSIKLKEDLIKINKPTSKNKKAIDDAFSFEQELLRLQEQQILLDENTQEYRDLQLEKLQLYKDEEERIETDAEGTRLVNAKKAQDAKIKITKLEKENQLKLYQAIGDGLGQLSDILGKETATGKGIAVAGALINTYAAISGQLQAFSKVPIPGYAIAQAVVTGLSGFAAVKNIMSVKVPNASEDGSVAIPQFQPPQAAPTQAQSPSFNIVGSSGTNQLATAIGSQTQQPIQAYVVSNDITSAQSLDRNIVESSSLG